MSKKFVTSDEHYFHAKLLEIQKRPFKNVEEMNETMIKNHNSVVKPEDETWHLGDLFLGLGTDYTPMLSVMERLNGKHHWVLGNHDSPSKVEFLKKFFTSVQHYAEVKAGKTLVVMFHYPTMGWRESKLGSVMLHGHWHGGYQSSFPGKFLDVGVDPQNFFPIEIEKAVEKLKDRPVFDHHAY